MEAHPPVRINMLPDTQPSQRDTTFRFTQRFSDGLFSVKSLVHINWPHLDNDLYLTQERPIRLYVANTLDSGRSRVLTYVSSSYFDSWNTKHLLN